MKTKNYEHIINEMLGEIYQDKELFYCLKSEIKIHPERIRILHQIVMNYDRMSCEELWEKVYRYAALIEEEDLLARQLLLCLQRLVKK